ncbi:MAG: diaminopimelate epimerase, partial [Chloroflexi bacterium]|nr:diaminopimelate epimerase [Chloroflexota bacterium]
MSIPFLKVQGAGNDFVLIDAMGENAYRAEFDWSALAPRICNRHVGIGADGILSARNSDLAPAQKVMVNADGSKGDKCG